MWHIQKYIPKYNMELKCILFLTITIIVLMKFAGSSSDCPLDHTKIRFASKIKFIIIYHKFNKWITIWFLFSLIMSTSIAVYVTCKPIKIDKNVFKKTIELFSLSRTFQGTVGTVRQIIWIQTYIQKNLYTHLPTTGWATIISIFSIIFRGNIYYKTQQYTGCIIWI